MKFLIFLIVISEFSFAQAGFYGSCNDPKNGYCSEFFGSKYSDENEKIEYCSYGSGEGVISDSPCPSDVKPGCRYHSKTKDDYALYGYGNVKDVLNTACAGLGGVLQD